jgi:hypothetical protein
MNIDSKPALWAVQWFHKDGYQAPYQVIEAKKREDAIKIAKEVNCVLRNFKSWGWKIVKLPYQLNENGKWVSL